MKCRIGQKDRCEFQGYCSWEKIFNESCKTKKEIALQDIDESLLKLTYRMRKKVRKQLTAGVKKPKKTPVKKTESQRRGDRRKKIWERGNGICYLCGEPVLFAEFTIDHVIPISAGGTNNLRNLRPTHYSCNQEKGCKIL